jgi:hypothetical protein
MAEANANETDAPCPPPIVDNVTSASPPQILSPLVCVSSLTSSRYADGIKKIYSQTVMVLRPIYPGSASRKKSLVLLICTCLLQYESFHPNIGDSAWQRKDLGVPLSADDTNITCSISRVRLLVQ